MRRMIVSCLAAAFLLSAGAASAQCPGLVGGVQFGATDCRVGGDTFSPMDSLVFTMVPGQFAEILNDSTVGLFCPGYGLINVSGASQPLCVQTLVTGSAGGTYSWDYAACDSLDSGFITFTFINGSIPCDAVPGSRDTVTSIMYVCAADTCPASTCAGQDTVTFFVDVIAAPPAIAVVCADTAFAESGVSIVTVPFDICNPDPCADTLCYDYDFTASSNVGGLQGAGSGQVNVAPGDCERVNVVLDATLAADGDTSLICMAAATPCGGAVAFDTCYTFLIIVPTAEDVPLFSTPMAAILILTLVLMAAGIMRRRALVS